MDRSAFRTVLDTDCMTTWILGDSVLGEILSVHVVGTRTLECRRHSGIVAAGGFITARIAASGVAAGAGGFVTTTGVATTTGATTRVGISRCGDVVPTSILHCDSRLRWVQWIRHRGDHVSGMLRIGNGCYRLSRMRSVSLDVVSGVRIERCRHIVSLRVWHCSHVVSGMLSISDGTDVVSGRILNGCYIVSGLVLQSGHVRSRVVRL